MDVIKELGVNEEFMKAVTGNVLANIDDNIPEQIGEYDKNFDELSQRIIETMKSEMPVNERQAKLKTLMDKQDEIGSRRAKLQEGMASHNLAKYRTEGIIKEIENLRLITEFNERSFKEVVEKIIMQDGIATFIFKCGLEMRSLV